MFQPTIESEISSYWLDWHQKLLLRVGVSCAPRSILVPCLDAMTSKGDSLTSGGSRDTSPPSSLAQIGSLDWDVGDDVESSPWGLWSEDTMADWQPPKEILAEAAIQPRLAAKLSGGLWNGVKLAQLSAGKYSGCWRFRSTTTRATTSVSQDPAHQRTTSLPASIMRTQHPPCLWQEKCGAAQCCSQASQVGHSLVNSAACTGLSQLNIRLYATLLCWPIDAQQCTATS